MFLRTKTIYFFLFIVLTISLYPQTDSLESVNIYFDKNNLMLRTDEGDTVLMHSFTAPYWFYVDLNNDTNDELVVIDSIGNTKNAVYDAYIYTADTTFHLLDSISSGMFFPVIEYNEELGATLLLTGIPATDSLYQAIPQDSLFTPVQYFQYNGFSLKNVSDDVYSTYLNENNAITTYLEDKNIAGSVCSQVQKYRTAVFTVFLYYRKAGEFSLANKFLQQYYPCPDAAAVKKILEKHN